MRTSVKAVEYNGKQRQQQSWEYHYIRISVVQVGGTEGVRAVVSFGQRHSQPSDVVACVVTRLNTISRELRKESIIVHLINIIVLLLGKSLFHFFCSLKAYVLLFIFMTKVSAIGISCRDDPPLA